MASFYSGWLLCDYDRHRRRSEAVAGLLCGWRVRRWVYPWPALSLTTGQVISQLRCCNSAVPGNTFMGIHDAVVNYGMLTSPNLLTSPRSPNRPVPPGAAPKGVYSPAQLARRASLYANQCARCHGASMEGLDVAPPLTGQRFLSNWTSQSVAELAKRIRTSMRSTCREPSGCKPASTSPPPSSPPTAIPRGRRGWRQTPPPSSH
jgi:cytochrome c553